jgi:sec-independent protein translocase protein TatC
MVSAPHTVDRDAGEGADGDRHGTMGFLEHLDELRKRLIRSCIAIGLGMCASFFFVERIASVVLAPTLSALPPGTLLITTKLGEGFAFYLDIALLGGVILAAPFVLYQVWRFIAPGLYASEKRLAVPFVFMAALGTIAGALFSHFLLFPSMVAFFATFDSPLMKFSPRVEDTFVQYRNMLLAMIAVFQLPTLVFFLARTRVITARFLWRRIKHAVLIIFVAAAILTPGPDPWTQAALAAPMLAMYAISILVAWLVAPRGARDDPDRSRHLRLVITASVLEQGRRRHRDRVVRGRTPWRRLYG